jgi:stearoyl-CoA desaturase (delta-9 desaturase)
MASHASWPVAAGVGGRLVWLNVVGIGGVHLLSLLAFVPGLFSWTGVAAAAAGLLVFGLLGTNLCFHRLLTHRSFDCPKWFEHALALLGTCCLQDTPAWWVATHRQHHQHSDEQTDPHSPLISFLWSHVGWLLIDEHGLSRHELYDRYARDVLSDPFYMRIERNLRYAQIYFVHCLVIFAVALAAGCLLWGDAQVALRFAASVTVWGAFFRTVLVWHITWLVNSATHLWGYRTHSTHDNSRNNLLVGYLAAGEGWHNNHHARQRNARHGYRWWEIDVTYVVIRLLCRLGLAWDVVNQPFPAADAGARHDDPSRASAIPISQPAEPTAC